MIPTLMHGKHIIGGVIYYEFVSKPNPNTNRYKIILKMYRDCIPGPNKADFDGVDAFTPKALFSIFRGSTLINGELDFGRPNIRRIDGQTGNPCIEVPPGICVEEGTYETIVDLPIINQSYHIVYQRCCRNESITNILRPGDSGSSFYVELTPVAQQLSNSCPQFVNFPPILICSGFPIDFDHSVIDKDGDMVQYSLCAPFLGGGNDTQSESCDGVAPNPECPPPYDVVTFRAPYTSGNPIGGNPGLQIGTNGLLTGVPATLGQFTVGICVREYRDNVLISEIRRDFQFNVTNCLKSIDATIEASIDDINVKGKAIDIRLCGKDALFMKLANPSADKIFSYDWIVTSESGNVVGMSNTENVLVNFPSIGNYNGKVILNKGLACADSSYINILVFPKIEADFTHQYDTCFGQVIDLTNLSHSDAGPISTSQWLANDVPFSQNFNANYNPIQPDFYDMKLIVTDQNQCIDSITRQIPFFPIPPDQLETPEDKVGCEPYLHVFEKPFDYITDDYNVVWGFGDGSSGDGISPQHTYTEPGIYSVTVDIVNYFGCKISGTFDQLITVLQSPDAGFSYSPQDVSNLKPTISVVDESQNSSIWHYYLSNGETFNSPNWNYTFIDTGLFVITQIVSHTNGCVDSISSIIDVVPKYTLYLPNAFVPSTLNENASYGPKGIPFGIRYYEMMIFDRWGNKVFETQDFNHRWDGRSKDGRIMMNGTYAVRVKLIGPRGETNEIKGTAILIQ